MERTKRSPTKSTLTRLTPAMVRILALAYRYRYLDIKHLLELLPNANKRDYLRLLNLKPAGLINYLHNPTFSRDRLTDSQVFEITPEGEAQLALYELPPKVTWLGAGNYKNPHHNLCVCLAIASIELACER